MTTTEPLLTIALERGLCTVENALEGWALTEALARESGLPCVSLAGRTIPAGILAALPRSFVLEHAVLSFAREDGVLPIAVADPIALDVIDSLGHVAGTEVRPALAPEADLHLAIERYYGPGTGEPADFVALESEAPTAASPSSEEGSASERHAPVIRLVQGIIAEAIRRRASDIHLEPLDKRTMREDGIRKVLAGLTTIEEIVAVTVGDSL